MLFCMKCGEKLPKDAEFCSKCGTKVGALPEVEKKDYSGIGGTLILVGGILALIFSIFPLAFMFLWRGMMEGWMGMQGMWGRWNMPFAIAGWLMGFMVIGAIISIIIGIVAIYAYTRIRGGEVKSGGTIAIILGVIMLVTMNWLPGIITLIGGILCYTSK